MTKNILSVAQVNGYIKNLLETDYIVKRLWVQGEISNCKIHSSGHIYFTLKDSLAAISCVLFKGYQQSQTFKLKDGMKVVAQGSISVYERTGQYQLYVKEIIEDGIGLLYERFEALKNRLDALGYFSNEHKKPIPFYPRKVGIVTSDTGAAIRDIINIASRRNPYIQLVLYPSLVQGEEAKHSIVKGIEYLDSIPDIDVIIIGRGGGSIEDLWAFNEEMVAQAIFAAQTPIISAVGHETDFTIADFVSDLRAPTPSAAAELAIPSIESLNELLRQYRNKLNQMLYNKIEQKTNLIRLYQAKLLLFNPKRTIEQNILYLNDLQDSLENAIKNKINLLRTDTRLLSERLRSVSPIHKLASGYSYISDEFGNTIKSIDQIEVSQNLNVQLIDGQIEVQVVRIMKDRGIANERKDI